MVIIIYTHPHRKGYNGIVLNAVMKRLDVLKKSYKVLDLYKMNFNPILTEKEHYTSGNKFVAPDVKRIQDMFDADQEYIFIYPTWWFSGPAMIKGFLDRVLTPGWAYKFTRQKLNPLIPLKLRKGHATIITTADGPTELYYLTQYIPGASLVKNTLSLCGLKSKLKVFGWLKHRDREKNTSIIEKSIARMNF